MNAWQTFKWRMAQAGVWFYCFTGLYRLKSWFVKSFNWKRRADLKGFEDFFAFVKYIESLKWTADTWKELGDSFKSPKHVQWLADNEPSKLVGDCDDFALYEATSIKEHNFYPNSPWKIENTFVMTVMWYDTEKEFMGGHNVCLLRTQNGWQWMDYGFPYQTSKTLSDVAKHVLSVYTKNATLIRWAVCDTSIRYLSTGTK